MIFSYINYSNIAAKVLRRSLKPEFRTEAMRRDESHVRITPWANGRPARKCNCLNFPSHEQVI